METPCNNLAFLIAVITIAIIYRIDARLRSIFKNYQVALWIKSLSIWTGAIIFGRA